MSIIKMFNNEYYDIKNSKKVITSSYKAEKKSWDDIKENDIVIESSLGEIDTVLTFWHISKKNNKSAIIFQCLSDGTSPVMMSMSTRGRVGRTKISRWVLIME